MTDFVQAADGFDMTSAMLPPDVPPAHPSDAPPASAPDFAAAAEPAGEAPLPEAAMERLRAYAEARHQAEERAARREAENLALVRMLEQQRAGGAAPPQPEDPVAVLLNDPDAFVGSRLGGVMEALADQREFYSRRDAERAHGGERVGQAYQALRAAIDTGAMDGPAVVAQLRRSIDPYGEIMRWHEQHLERTTPGLADERAVQRMLADPARRERLLAMLNEGRDGSGQGDRWQGGLPGAAASVAGDRGVVRLPPSLTRAGGHAGSGRGGGELTDNALFAYATQG